jgi:hypothetical protein
MANINLQDLSSGKFSLSKGAVFYTTNTWDFNSQMTLNFLGFTEGEISFTANEEFQTLTIDENTGPLIHDAYVQGEAPVLTIPIFTGSPALRSILSPTGTASGGYERQVPVKTRTLVVFPEVLFLSADGQDTKTLTYNTAQTRWELDGVAATTAQNALIGQSLWIWKGHFTKPDVVYRHADAGKSVDEVTFTAWYQGLAPNGARAYHIGDPASIGIDINTGIVGS